MGKIKSALELALEKTADLKTDKKAVKKNMMNREGKVSVSTFLENPKKSEFIDKMKFYKDEELGWFKNGAMDTILANITLPRLESDSNKLIPLNAALAIVSGDKEETDSMFEQLKQLFSQYLSNLDQLEASMKQQYEPQLRQKEQQLSQQSGQEVHLTPEQDPEFLKVLSEQISRMDQQYQDVLKQAKDQIRKGLI
ncbi:MULTISPECIES: DUF6657 family protein [unclassified Oceanispirochaeta]|uniref:DUF6657 family protein n=1 Tax=unclassified Oceanispirochaeta TaxID=2635722 RepID=UPI0011C04721|nr:MULTISPECIES: DUF6657 family protein [unclassified Oceanispirochaeta]MBF9018338.1 hypothetical protein [Oceanispirochaeta sp. M2]NPD74803.1 hypothetical protein [Oceanispirochaeta sp. M1]